MDKKLEGHVSKDERENEDLHQISLFVQAIGVKLTDLFHSTDDEMAIEELEKVQESAEQLQAAVGHVRTRILQGAALELKEFRKEINKELQKLEKIVKVIERINELIEIGEQFAAIAAGLAKL